MALPVSWKSRVKQAVTTGGTGALVLGAAVSPYQALVAGDNAKDFTYVIEDGTAWETGRGTYTSSGTSFARTLREDSSTGSALNVTTAAFVYVDIVASTMQSLTDAMQTYISGLIVTKNTGGNTLDISAGKCYDPSSGKIISYAGATAVSAGTLGASQWNQVYLYDNAGTATIEVVNNAAPPSTVYAGTARQGGTNSNRRLIGSFLTTAASAIYAQSVRETASGALEVVWFTPPNAAPFRVLTTGTSETFAAVSLVGCVPRYVASSVLLNIIVDNGTASVSQTIILSVDGTNAVASVSGYIVTAASTYPPSTLLVPIEAATPQIYYKMISGGTPKGFLDVSAFGMSR